MCFHDAYVHVRDGVLVVHDGVHDDVHDVRDFHDGFRVDVDLHEDESYREQCVLPVQEESHDVFRGVHDFHDVHDVHDVHDFHDVHYFDLQQW